MVYPNVISRRPPTTSSWNNKNYQKLFTLSHSHHFQSDIFSFILKTKKNLPHFMMRTDEHWKFQKLKYFYHLPQNVYKYEERRKQSENNL